MKRREFFQTSGLLFGGALAGFIAPDLRNLSALAQTTNGVSTALLPAQGIAFAQAVGEPKYHVVLASQYGGALNWHGSNINNWSRKYNAESVALIPPVGVGTVSGLSMVYSTDQNLELAALIDKKLYLFTRPATNSEQVNNWPSPPQNISASLNNQFDFVGNPSLIENALTSEQAREMIIPLKQGGILHLNSQRGEAWKVAATFGANLGNVEAVTLVQNRFETDTAEEFDVIARVGNQLYHLRRRANNWTQPDLAADAIYTQATGTPTLLQSEDGVLRLVTPSQNGGLVYFKYEDSPGINSDWVPIGDVIDASTLYQGAALTQNANGQLELVAHLNQRDRPKGIKTFATASLETGQWSSTNTLYCEETKQTDLANKGLWMLPFWSGVMGVHAAVLHTGDVLFLGYDANKTPEDPSPSAVLNLANGNIAFSAPEASLFCSGHSLLADGRLLVVSGMRDPWIKQLHLFSPDQAGGKWQRVDQVLTHGRWYPTLTTLPDGRVFILGGAVDVSEDPNRGNLTYQIFDPSSPGTLSPDQDAPFMTAQYRGADGGSYRGFDRRALYPFVFVLPNKKLFMLSKGETVFFNLSNNSVDSNEWLLEPGPKTFKQQRTYPYMGSAVLLPLNADGTGNSRVLLIGGGDDRGLDPSESRLLVQQEILQLREEISAFGDDTTLSAAEKRAKQNKEEDLVKAERKERRLKIADNRKAMTVAASANCEILSIGSTPFPEWQAVAPMNHGRVMLDALLLPDGTVFVTNGSSNGYPDNKAIDPVFEAEIYEPDSNTWKTMNPMRLPRLYHSATVLLPDARVMIVGGDAMFNSNPYKYAETRAEVFSPPYLFKGQRPKIISVNQGRSKVAYNSRFNIETPNAQNIDRVALIRPSTVTHSMNMDQRYINLPVLEKSANTISVQSPKNGFVAPPGYYMLFILSQGVPSVARWVQL